jgi:archaetidylinositol phosphate synthase
LLNRFRKAIEPTLNRMGVAASRTGLPADAWTGLGLAISVVAAAFYALPTWGGSFVGGALLLLSGLTDIIDGAVARIRGESSPRGSFLDSTLDRIAEVVVFAGIVLSGAVPPVLVLLALALSLLVSYTRAKGESFGLAVSGIGVGERAERILVLGILSLVGLVYYGVVVVLALAAVTFGHRMLTLSKTLARGGP